MQFHARRLFVLVVVLVLVLGGLPSNILHEHQLFEDELEFEYEEEYEEDYEEDYEIVVIPTIVLVVVLVLVLGGLPNTRIMNICFSRTTTRTRTMSTSLSSFYFVSSIMN